ncbi:Hypothetical predicted protein [Octopus vulgaris]|uniref:Uncharacterized protein n=1 Tax=Octopus vulgaris TaxID=6645 RepID=A0AA36BFQ5_OCTVU|nr:Hypothetical predicted protein [Octopus vulgaris]
MIAIFVFVVAVESFVMIFIMFVVIVVDMVGIISNIVVADMVVVMIFIMLTVIIVDMRQDIRLVISDKCQTIVKTESKSNSKERADLENFSGIDNDTGEKK